MTIQIKPTDGADMEASVARAVDIAMQVPGVTAADALSRGRQRRRSWSRGSAANFDTAELPIPRLVAVRVAEDTDLAALARRLRAEVPGASSRRPRRSGCSGSRRWRNVMTLLGFVILALVFAATALCVVFATRGAMAGNRNVIEVLHFVGAEDSYVAREFQRHFLLLGLKGAGLGGAIAVAIFLGLRMFTASGGTDPGGSAAAQPFRRCVDRRDRLSRCRS